MPQRLFPWVLLLTACECGQLVIRSPDAGADAGPSQTDGGGDAGGGTTDGGGTDAGTDAGSLDAGIDGGADAGNADAGLDGGLDAGGDPCPSLPIPASCFNRTTVYREWSLTATGDGTYFASQAPWRLGFNRLKGLVWIVKVRTEANSYIGRLDAYGDNSGGIAWVSDKPCDASFAVANRFSSYGVHGGGSMLFLVVRDDVDAARVDTEPAFSAHRLMPRLRGDHCYYVAFENAATAPATAADYWSVADDCGDFTGTPDCYYLAFDFNHLLHVPGTGQLVNGNVVPGLTH